MIDAHKTLVCEGFQYTYCLDGSHFEIFPPEELGSGSCKSLHLRKLPLGYLYRRDPGDLANMMMGDFTLVETGTSHLLPQLAGAFVLPVSALAGMLFMDWRMALSMFAALPVAQLLQKKTGYFCLCKTRPQPQALRLSSLRSVQVNIEI